MGFFSGFLSGATLTSATIYLSLANNQRNRAAQSASLRQQALILNSVVEPELVAVEPRPHFVPARPSLTEAWKDRWNAEIEGLVRWCQALRWDDVRAATEGRVREWSEGQRRA